MREINTHEHKCIDSATLEVKNGLIWLDKIYPNSAHTMQESYADWANEESTPQWLLDGVANKLGVSAAQE